ncbi:MAG: glutathione S-transferase family protein [Alphaproteobacteria bacterium]
MYRLYHHPLDPFSRKIRLLLAEKNLPFELVAEKPWQRRVEFMALNAAGEVPVMIAVDGILERVLCDSTAIVEYIEETVTAAPMLGQTPEAKAEVRRLIGWFERKFHREVTQNLLDEKAFKRLSGSGEPDSQALRAGYANIHYHLDYIAWLTERRNWLAGDALTLADLAAAAQLSALDYLGDVPWTGHLAARDWYARLKSRPSFRPLLADHIAGFPPPEHYANLDF